MREENKRIAKRILEISDGMNKIRTSHYYTSEDMKNKKLEEISKDLSIHTAVEVVDEDVVNVAISEAKKGGKTCVLNFASARNPGGGFINGAVAQEESLCRGSDLYFYLKTQKDFYNNPKHFKNGLYDNDVIYSENVTFFNDLNNIDDNYNVDVITSAAVNLTDIRNKKQVSLFREVDREMRERIENIVELAVSNNIETLLLGAFGCGVFGNSGYKVRKYFEEVLNSERYRGKLKKIVFCVYKNEKLFNLFQDIQITSKS